MEKENEALRQKEEHTKAHHWAMEEITKESCRSNKLI